MTKMSTRKYWERFIKRLQLDIENGQDITLLRYVGEILVYKSRRTIRIDLRPYYVLHD